jgi:hypothetical protein
MYPQLTKWRASFGNPIVHMERNAASYPRGTTNYLGFQISTQSILSYLGNLIHGKRGKQHEDWIENWI